LTVRTALSKDFDVVSPIECGSQGKSQRKSAEKRCITVDSNQFPQGHKVEGCVQLRMSGSTQLAFNSVNTWPSKRRGVMISEFDKKPPVSEGTESGNDSAL